MFSQLFPLVHSLCHDTLEANMCPGESNVMLISAILEEL